MCCNSIYHRKYEMHLKWYKLPVCLKVVEITSVFKSHRNYQCIQGFIKIPVYSKGLYKLQVVWGMVYGICGNMNTDINMNMNVNSNMNIKMEHKYEIYICSNLVWKLHWENEVKWRYEIGEQLLKSLTILKLLTTNCTNTTNYKHH